MWARVVELMLGAWLIVSPFIFRGTPAADGYTLTMAAAGSLVVVLSLAAYWPPLRRANGATLLVAFAVAAHGYFSAPRPGPPAAQNEIVVGLLLMMFAVVPTEASRPPVAWRERQRS